MEAMAALLDAIRSAGLRRALQEHLLKAAVEAAATEAMRCGRSPACKACGVLGEVEDTLLRRAGSSGSLAGRPARTSAWRRGCAEKTPWLRTGRLCERGDVPLPHPRAAVASKVLDALALDATTGGGDDKDELQAMTAASSAGGG